MNKNSLGKKDVIDLLSQTIYDLRKGKISLRKAKGLASLCQHLLKAREAERTPKTKMDADENLKKFLNASVEKYKK